MAADGGYRDRMRLRIAADLERHMPDNVGMLCAGHLADGELDDWPCNEARYAVMVQLAMESRTKRRS